MILQYRADNSKRGKTEGSQYCSRDSTSFSVVLAEKAGKRKRETETERGRGRKRERRTETVFRSPSSFFPSFLFEQLKWAGGFRVFVQTLDGPRLEVELTEDTLVRELK